MLFCFKEREHGFFTFFLIALLLSSVTPRGKAQSPLIAAGHRSLCPWRRQATYCQFALKRRTFHHPTKNTIKNVLHLVAFIFNCTLCTVECFFRKVEKCWGNLCANTMPKGREKVNQYYVLNAQRGGQLSFNSWLISGLKSFIFLSPWKPK